MKPGYVAPLVLLFFLAGCLIPGGGPSPTPPPTSAPTPSPTLTPGTTYSTAQLKYLLLDHFGESRFFYCDPDYYPIAHGDEAEKAVSTFPEIQEDTSTFSAIVARKGLQPPYSNETKLVIYRDYKKLRAIPFDPVSGGSYRFSLQLGTFSEGHRVYGFIRGDGVILSEQSETAILTCPICLAGETRIDTPAGPVPVKEIRRGMLVWTPGPGGTREAVPVLHAEKTRVPSGHRVVHVRLSDGRELDASPGHPLADGRLLGTLSVGDIVDGARVTGTDLVPVTGGFTYDILPAGDTGGYWANGIPLESTLL
jgi:hypothetical protein